MWQKCVQYGIKNTPPWNEHKFRSTLQSFFLWLYGLYFEINTAAVLICGCHWTSSNTGYHSHLA